ncbi:MAG: GIY-YIG nuclease family protein [Candidatus Omnitrophica bacterium]|nr:GIY-YIG nuclease family protein [Candidatus Omnitrophota bacterium]
MHYVYVLQSLKDGEFYTGFTSNLERRIKEHNDKNQFSTQNRGPLKLIYYEGCLEKEDAIVRERYLKSGMGKKYLRYRLKNYLALNSK